jgi:tetratricopeptide (TPR) repeat protein
MTGIHMKRADAAIAEKRYLTAENELRKVMAVAPEMKNAKSQMLIASFYMMDLNTFVSMTNELKGVSFDDGSTINTLNGLVADAGNFFPTDSLNELLDQKPLPADIQNRFRLYVLQHPHEPFAVVGYVNMFGEKDRLSWCDSVIHNILNTDPGYIPGIIAAVSIARSQRHYDSALNYCHQLLSINTECQYAIASEARISLAQGELSQGIALAKKACALDSTDGFSEATLALGYHMNHQPGERDQLIKRGSSDSSISFYMDYVKQVIEGKEKFN